MASSSAARPLLLVLLLLLSSLSTVASDLAAPEAPGRGPASPRPAVAHAGEGRQDFDVAAAAAGTGQPDAGMAKNGASARRPVTGKKRNDGGTGAWAFSAMLPRGFVPPSGSSACHNDMPTTAADTQFFACGGAGSP